MKPKDVLWHCLLSVFVALSLVGTVACFQVAFYGEPSGIFDDTREILLGKGITGIIMSVAGVYLLFSNPKQQQTRPRPEALPPPLPPEPLLDSYRHFAKATGDSEPIN